MGRRVRLQVAKYCQRFGVRVLGFDPIMKQGVAEKLGIELVSARGAGLAIAVPFARSMTTPLLPWCLCAAALLQASLEDLYAQSDFITLHMPLLDVRTETCGNCNSVVLFYNNCPELDTASPSRVTVRVWVDDLVCILRCCLAFASKPGT